MKKLLHEYSNDTLNVALTIQKVNNNPADSAYGQKCIRVYRSLDPTIIQELSSLGYKVVKDEVIFETYVVSWE